MLTAGAISIVNQNKRNPLIALKKAEFFTPLAKIVAAPNFAHDSTNYYLKSELTFPHNSTPINLHKQAKTKEIYFKSLNEGK